MSTTAQIRCWLSKKCVLAEQKVCELSIWWWLHHFLIPSPTFRIKFKGIKRFACSGAWKRADSIWDCDYLFSFIIQCATYGPLSPLQMTKWWHLLLHYIASVKQMRKDSLQTVFSYCHRDALDIFVRRSCFADFQKHPIQRQPCFLEDAEVTGSCFFFSDPQLVPTDGNLPSPPASWHMMCKLSSS